MGNTLYGKPYGLTCEEMLKAHHILTATAKKTPYQLDLEVKDRKPDIVPKVGDKVKIKSREWYEKWKDDVCGSVSFPGTECIFSFKMKQYCGKELIVSRIDDTHWGNRWILGSALFNFTPEMFEEVYPQESSKEAECAKTFESLGITANALDKPLTVASAIPAINPIQGTGLPIDWSKLIKCTSARITFPQHLSPASEVDSQAFPVKKEPELQTIKKHRFIKLEKL